MIYLVTRQHELFADGALYLKTSIDKVIAYLQSVEETAFDSEATGLCCHQDRLHCIQLGDRAQQYVIDCSSIDISVLKELLETKLLIMQHGKSGLKSLYKKGIYPRKIFDTFIAEQVLFCGIDSHRAGLDLLAGRYLGIQLDKSRQNTIEQEGLTSEDIQYAADDIALLPAIREKQLEVLQVKGLTETANLENRFTPVLAYIEYCGFKLDIELWQAKMKKDNERLSKATDALNDWIISRRMTKYMNRQISLFEPAACTINWSSSKQVIELFEGLGINCTIADKEGRKKSVEADVVKKQKDKFPVISLYLEYQSAKIVTTTYGQKFIDQVNPVTGRLHTSFKQIVSTGRLSSGGKNGSTDYLNFQNIPAGKQTRACFVAEPGNTLVISDYAGQEQIILANRSMDPGLLEFYDKGLADMHSFVAAKIFPELEGLAVDVIKEDHGDKRDKAKSTGFSIIYGGEGSTIAGKLGIPVEEGKQIYKDYFVAFPGLEDYFKQSKKQGLRDGYILVSELTGRKSYIPFFEEYKALEQTCNNDFWKRYRKAKANNSPGFIELKKLSSAYFKMKGEIERATLNYPVQGTGSEIMKVSCICIFDYIVDNDLFGIVKFVNTIHDENVLECPVAMDKTIADMVRDAMSGAGDIYCKRIPLKAEPDLCTHWRK